MKEWLKQDFSKVKLYDYILWKNYLSVIGIVSSIVTILSFFITAQCMNEKAVYVAIGFICMLIFIFIGMWWKANHQTCVKLKINNTKVQIQEGDIFELLKKKPEERNGEISIVAVNDYYDTIVDDRIVAKKQYMDNILIELFRQKN